MSKKIEYEYLKYLGDDITFCAADCDTPCRRKPKYIMLKDRPHSFANFSTNCMAYEPKEVGDNGDKERAMTVGELIKKLNKRDKSNKVYYIDKYGKHEITDVKPMLTKDGSVTIIMNGDGGRYEREGE